MSSWPNHQLLKATAAMAVFGMTLLQGTASGPAGQQAQGEDKVLAEIDGFQLTASALESILQVIPEATRKDIDTPEGRQRFIRNYLEQKAMALEAQALGLMQDPVVQKEIEFSREQVLSEALQKHVVQEIQVTDAEIEAYYEQNREEFKHPVMARVSRILVGRQEEALQIISRAEAGESFAELASAHSKDIRSKQRGGRLGWVRPGQMEPAVEQVIFGLGPGQIGPPVRTVQGWHVLQVNDRREAGYMNLDTVREPLRVQLLGEKRNQALQSVGQEAFQRRGGKIYPDGQQP